MENAKWHKYIDNRIMKLKYTSLNKIKWGGGMEGYQGVQLRKQKKKPADARLLKVKQQ